MAPTLAECRARVQAHGDVFPWLDPHRSAWWRRPDVSALREHIRTVLDNWLSAPVPNPALPLNDRKTLDWSARQVDAPLHVQHPIATR